jgi:hypothetical protein
MKIIDDLALQFGDLIVVPHERNMYNKSRAKFFHFG